MNPSSSNQQALAPFIDDNELKRFAIQFLNSRLNSLKKDVDHCLKGSLAPFPAILYCFSTIDLLGSLYGGHGRSGNNTKDSINYLKQFMMHSSRTGGKGLDRSRYYSIKKSLIENEFNECHSRMDRHAKTGFVINHFKRIDELEHLQNILFKAVYNETNKPVKEQSLLAISKIASNIAMNSRLLVELNISSPIIDQMKAEIDKALKSQSERRSLPEKDMELWNTPSACILTEEFIKSSHWVDPASLNSSTDRVKDRVF